MTNNSAEGGAAINAAREYFNEKEETERERERLLLKEAAAIQTALPIRVL